MPLNATRNDQLEGITVGAIAPADAKRLCVRHHYMQTYPAGALVSLGVFYEGRCRGVCVLGKSSTTAQKVAKLATLEPDEYLEMQRLWIHDMLGHNAESYTLSLVMRLLRQSYPRLKLVYTHAGGCKNDCGIVYQASGWLYFGKSPCHDFYQTTDGAYRNMVAALRFGRVQVAGRSRQEIGEELFGPGEVVDSWRYTYAYPVSRGVRRRLAKVALPFPKDSAQFRYRQEWR